MGTSTTAVRSLVLIALPAATLAASASGAPLEPTGGDPPPLDVLRSEDPGPPSCGPGPQRVSDMQTMAGGYLRARPPQSGGAPHEFYLVRGIYTDGRRGGFFRRGGDYLGDRGPAWSIDYPTADRVMVRLASRLTNLDACEWERPVSLADPQLRRFPFLYSLEWGYATLTDAEAEGLRGYLEAGGFLMLDDFWGTAEWANFEAQIRRVFPDRPIVEVPRDHVLFRSYYTIEGEIMQVPNLGNGRAVGMGFPGARTSERDGYTAHLRGIFDDDGRLMVAINWNTDLGDALEWAEDPEYPLEFSTFASQIFLNHIIYAMTH